MMINIVVNWKQFIMGVVKVDKDTIYYFIGIKGSGMSSLALILHDEGYQVEGSDVDGYVFTQDGLAAAGIKVLPFNRITYVTVWRWLRETPLLMTILK